jgi:hypothetical protein
LAAVAIDLVSVYMESGKIRVILWKSSTVSPRRASFRYRVALPAIYLERLGVRSKFRSSTWFLRLRGIQAVVISKTFETADIAIARMAQARRIPIVLDLCDNIFAEPYPVRARIVFEQIARLASLVVTTTPALARVVANQTECPSGMVSIPDPVENLKDTRALCERFRVLELTEECRLRVLPVIFRLRRWVRRCVAAIRKHFGRGLTLRLVTSSRSLITSSVGHRTVAHPGSSTPPPAAQRHAPSFGAVDEPTRTIVWFGNHGGDSVDFGMLDLLLAVPAIATIARKFRIKLRVISNNAEKFQHNIASLPFPTEYLEWHPIRCHEWIRESDVVIIPNQLNEFSRYKSANRALLALQNRIPVVATRTPALADLDGCVTFDDWEHGIESYLTDSQLRERHLMRAAEVIDARFAPDRVARGWLTAIERATLKAAEVEKPPATKPVVVFLLQLIQDLELILPLYRRALSVHDWSPELWATTLDLFDRPEMRRRLEAEGGRYTVVDPRLATRGGFPGWEGVAALISASETSLEPHAEAHLTVRWAKRHGVRTFTLQHGFENVGLTYSDQDFPIETVRFASDVIFLWGPLETLHRDVRDDTRRKCIPIGCPKPLDGRPSPVLDTLGKPLVAVFENLHWGRFSAEYQDCFLEHLGTVARQMPDVSFVVKPHPAGRWITERFKGMPRLPPNVTIANSRAQEWVGVSAADILRHAAAAVTTPSTIALDAARLERPVALVAYGLDLSNYRPLPLLHSPEDWDAFLVSALGERNEDLVERSKRFAAGATIEGDAIGRMLEVVADRIGLPRQPARGCGAR